MADTDSIEKTHESKHAVRFPDSVNDSVNEIHVLKLENSSSDVEIHAGFFKVDHKYEVEFELEDTIGLGNNPAVEIPPGVHMELKQVHSSNSGIKLTIEYSPSGMDGVVEEMFAIKSADSSNVMKGIFRAEVLGQGQGTPMLKDGVKCIHRPHSANSSASR